MRKDLLSKTLVLGVVVLFVGVGVAPSITAELSIQTELINNKFQNNNNELVETIVEIHEIDEIKEHAVMLTIQQADELDNLIDDFKMGLDNSRTMEETIELYYDMVESLDEFGLLPDDMTLDEAQQLVTDSNEQFKQLAMSKYQTSTDLIENYDCLITGEATYVYKTGITWSNRILEVSPAFGMVLLGILGPYLEILSMNLLSISPPELNRWFPFPVNIAFGYWWETYPNEIYYKPSEGWIETRNGLMSDNRIEGSFYGQIDRVYRLGGEYNVGATGFRGIKIRNSESGKTFLEGSATHVKLGPNPLE